MVDYKNIELALIEVIKVAYSQGIKKYDKLGASYVNYLKTLQRKRDPEDHIKYYNEEIYTSLEKLYKLYLEIANQEEKVEKRTKLQVDEILQKIHSLKI
ncbi:20118_t:CDS:2 [Gigaspora margarita]|uniref:20118_t:CDS:1 n=1 Tax=Gigaspora margarita TaxID=4874 RepID=A0ABN7WEL3_GIGMA|nr:20118_t:CDS:2 [Gigaspora margarita]